MLSVGEDLLRGGLEDNMGIKVGIDLGTTYSLVARIGPDGKPKIIRNSFGDTATPSVVCFEDGEVLYGREAKEAQECGSPDCFATFKRAMGDPYFSIDVDGNCYTAADFSAGLLRHMVEEAEDECGQTIDAAVVTVPAYFQNAQREATKEACRKAGIKLISLLNEPSAAAYAYGLNGPDDKTVMIYDLGGGTFDVTISHITKDQVQVVSVEGDHHLGGKDWDMALVDLMLESFCEQTGMDKGDLDLTDGEQNILEVTAENLKRQLTARPRVSTKLRLCGQREEIVVTRADFEAYTEFLVSRTEGCCQDALNGAGLTWHDIDEVALVGGSTRMPMVPAFVERMIGHPPMRGINPDEAVALGAAIYANLQSKGEARLTYGSGGAKPIISLSGAKRLDDCTGYALGIVAESADRTRYINSIIIRKNAPVPAKGTHDYAIRVPEKGGELEAYVLQGQEERPSDNLLAGKYVVKDIQREGSGESLVRVTYSYASDSTIHVSATQPHLNRQLKVEKSQVDDDLSRFDGSPLDETLALKKQMANHPIMICLDVSGSMYGQGFRATVPAVESLLKTLEDTDIPVGLMLFARLSRVILKPSVQYDEIRRAVSSLRVMNHTTDRYRDHYCQQAVNCLIGKDCSSCGIRFCSRLLGGTCARPISDYENWARIEYKRTPKQITPKQDSGHLLGRIRGALVGDASSSDRAAMSTEGAQANAVKGAQVQDTLFIITDGMWQWSRESISDAQNLATEGTQIVAVGVADADESFLRQIATRDEFAAKTSFEGMGEVFSSIGRVITAEDKTLLTV